MKSLLLSRTFAATGLALVPVAWIVSGCGGGGGGGGSSNPSPTRTPTSTPVPGAIKTPTPIPTPIVPNGGQRIVSNVDLGNGQIAVLNLVISRFGSISGLITVPPIPDDKTDVFLVQPGTYAITGAFSLPNNFRFGGSLKTVTNVVVPFLAVGQTPANGQPGNITVTAGTTTFPTQNF